jgi:hypothetical protein
MSEQEFITFQKLESQEDAENVIAILQEAGIAVQFETVATPVDVTFTGNAQPAEVIIKIHPDDFEKANEALELQARTVVVEYPDDHYIFNFTDDELMEVVQKEDEWSVEDFILAQKLLKERGKEVTEDQLHSFRKQRIEEFRKPVKGETGWIVFGFLTAFLGGLLGIIIGMIHYRMKKTDPTGHRFYAYDEPTRKSGRIMAIIGVAGFIGWALWWFFVGMNMEY